MCLELWNFASGDFNNFYVIMIGNLLLKNNKDDIEVQCIMAKI